MTAPNPGNILCGKFNSADGATGTLITIPAGHVWKGKLVLNATGAVAPSGAAVSSHATIQVSGSGTPTPASGQVLVDVFINVPAQTASTSGQVTGNGFQDVTLYADAANDLLVTVTKNSVTSFAATAFGELVV